MDSIQYIVVYGVPLDTASGGTRLQTYLFKALEIHAPVYRYVITSRFEANTLVDVLATVLGQSSGVDKDGLAIPRRDDVAVAPRGKMRTAIIIDGIALLWCGPEIISRFQSLNQVASVAALVHYPFSVPAYEHEPWLQTLLEDVDFGWNGSNGRAKSATLREFEAKILRIFDSIIAVGPACATRLAMPAFGVTLGRINELDAPLNPVVYKMPLLEPQLPLIPTSDDFNIPTIRLVTVGSVCPRKDQLTLLRALARVGTHRRSGNRRPFHLALTVVGDLQCDPVYAKECADLVASVPYIFDDRLHATSELSNCSSMSFSPGCDENTEVVDIGDNNIDATVSKSWSTSSPRGRIRKPRNSSSPFCRVSVALVGALPQSDALATVASSHGFLFASRFESFGLAPIEAAALGIPVCSTRVGALPSRLCPASTVWVEQTSGSEDPVDQEDESSRFGGREETKGVELTCSDSEHFDLEEAAASEERCQAWVHALETFLDMLTQRDGTAFNAARQNALAQRAGIENSSNGIVDPSTTAWASSLDHEAARLHKSMLESLCS